jgi:hypothetical protein
MRTMPAGSSGSPREQPPPSMTAYIVSPIQAMSDRPNPSPRPSWELGRRSATVSRRPLRPIREMRPVRPAMYGPSWVNMLSTGGHSVAS